MSTLLNTTSFAPIQTQKTVATATKPTVQPEENKPKLSKTQIGIGVGAVLVGGAIVAAMIAKGNFSGAKKAAQQINFKPAQTIEEAKAFAQEKLGVYIKDDMPLDVLNYTNEGLCHLKNKAPKDFRVSLIESSPIGGLYNSEGLAQFFAHDTPKGNIYGINMSSDYINNINKVVSEFMGGELERGVLIDTNGVLKYHEFFEKTDISNEIVELANKFKQNPNSLTFKEKVKLHLGMGDIGETMDRLYVKYNGDSSKLKNTVNIISDPFHPIYHEQGHMLHRDILSKEKFDLFDTVDVLEQKGLDTKFTNEFKEKYSEIAANVSDYSIESPLEFVGEVYAKSLAGLKFDKDILDLYKMYNGPKLLY